MSLLFDPKLIPQVVRGSMFRGYSIRPLKSDDIERGVLDVLAVLTTVGEVTPEQFGAQFDYWKQHKDSYFTVVILDMTRVVAVGTVFVERKLIHGTGKVGHIEDIAVAKNQQGKKLGLRIIQALTAIAKGQGCYKVILDCDPENVKFYEKCGYSRHGVEMVTRFDQQKGEAARL